MWDRAASFLLLRLFVYLAVGAAIFEGLVAIARGGHALALGAESGPLEIGQLAMVIATAAVLLVTAARSDRNGPLLRVLGAAALFAVARELDLFLDLYVGEHAYKLLTTPIGLYAAYIAWSFRTVLPGQVAAFLRTPAAAFLFAGFFVVVLYAQLVGQKALWQGIGSLDLMRPAKDIAEEISELLGYLLILIGAIETHVWDRSRLSRLE